MKMFKILSVFLFNLVVVLNAEPRIVGGISASVGQFPYQISLQVKHNKERSHICGGSLVDLQHVVTAAHCVTDRKASELLVWAGGINLDLVDDVQEVKTITIHPKWNISTLDSDIAILKLKKKFKSSTKISTINLANNVTKDRALCTISGWGYLQDGGQPSIDKLKYAHVYIKNHATCKRKYINLTGNMICAAAYGKDSCQGDSGGPLVCDGKLVGVVSHGIGCASPYFPGVYTNVYKFEDWIKKNSLASYNSIENIQIIAMILATTIYTVLFS